MIIVKSHKTGLLNFVGVVDGLCAMWVALSSLQCTLAALQQHSITESLRLNSSSFLCKNFDMRKIQILHNIAFLDSYSGMNFAKPDRRRHINQNCNKDRAIRKNFNNLVPLFGYILEFDCLQESWANSAQKWYVLCADNLYTIAMYTNYSWADGEIDVVARKPNLNKSCSIIIVLVTIKLNEGDVYSSPLL